jgi:hypothetical protein
MKLNLVLLLILLFSHSFSFSQELSFDHQSIEKRMHLDVGVLANDSLFGREAGSEWEIKARDYIQSEFVKAGLVPYLPNKSYLHDFSFKDGNHFEAGTFLKINGESFRLNDDFYPLSQSANGEIEAEAVYVGFGMQSPDGKFDDYKSLSNLQDKIFVIEVSVPGGASQFQKHIDYANLDAKLALAKAKGAKAVVFINTDSENTDPRNLISNRVEKIDFPVVFAQGEQANELKNLSKATITIGVQINKTTKTGYNVIGYLNNGASKSILIGAHYDHLGMGGESSRYRGEPAIHNGADDNASGVATVIELARYFKAHPIKNYNLIFMAFSGEEKGLLGSSAFVKSEFFHLDQLEVMLNFDMVGRLDSIKRSLTLIGTGTATEWDSIIKITNHHNLDIKRSASGISGSDQMSFYLAKLPVLFFFTGLHSDYHTPTDDLDRINFDGMRQVVLYAQDMIKTMDGFPKLTYNKTKDLSQGENRNYRKGVTLGIVPDFTSESQGVGVQAVLDDKPAAMAGLQAGDVVIKMGDTMINDIQDYMKSLQSFKKGDKTKVVALRNGKKRKFNIQF